MRIFQKNRKEIVSVMSIFLRILQKYTDIWLNFEVLPRNFNSFLVFRRSFRFIERKSAKTERNTNKYWFFEWFCWRKNQRIQ